MDSIVTPPPRPHHPRPLSFDTVCRRHGIDLTSSHDVSVTGVSINASQVVAGDIFFALPGSTHHGARFAEDAVHNGAVAIITDAEGRHMIGEIEVPVGVHEHPRQILGFVSRDVYDTEKNAPQVLAVTGTNGKTSVTYFLENICRRLGHQTALSNSTERRVAGEVFRTKLTTPESNELHAMLALAAEKHVHTLCLEASAQAIERFRLTGLTVAVAGFTNLSHDHFEDYGDMDQYLRTKAELFRPEYSGKAVICIDTSWGDTLAKNVAIPVWTLASSTSPSAPTADWVYEVGDTDGETTDFVVKSLDITIPSRISAVGEHMVQNAALAVVMVISSGQDAAEVAEAVSPASGGLEVVIPGRLEKVSGDSPVALYVDAGRSADAYEKTLTTLGQLATGRLIAVCGTSGNRDPSKRPIMGAVAARIANHVIITDDDPRWEDPADIRRGLLDGARSVPGGGSVEEIADPVDAISHAVAMASPGDVIVWSGPGSQNYREIQGERHPFSAKEEAKRVLRRHGLLGED